MARTIVANSILRALFPYHDPLANAQFNTLRLLEDYFYQAEARQYLIEVNRTKRMLGLLGNKTIF